jgi:hypothetical protein
MAEITLQNVNDTLQQQNGILNATNNNIKNLIGNIKTDRVVERHEKSSNRLKLLETMRERVSQKLESSGTTPRSNFMKNAIGFDPSKMGNLSNMIGQGGLIAGGTTFLAGVLGKLIRGGGLVLIASMFGDTLYDWISGVDSKDLQSDPEFTKHFDEKKKGFMTALLTTAVVGSLFKFTTGIAAGALAFLLPNLTENIGEKIFTGASFLGLKTDWYTKLDSKIKDPMEVALGALAGVMMLRVAKTLLGGAAGGLLTKMSGGILAGGIKHIAKIGGPLGVIAGLLWPTEMGNGELKPGTTPMTSSDQADSYKQILEDTQKGVVNSLINPTMQNNLQRGHTQSEGAIWLRGKTLGGAGVKRLNDFVTNYERLNSFSDGKTEMPKHLTEAYDLAKQWQKDNALIKKSMIELTDSVIHQLKDSWLQMTIDPMTGVKSYNFDRKLNEIEKRSSLNNSRMLLENAADRTSGMSAAIVNAPVMNANTNNSYNTSSSNTMVAGSGVTDRFDTPNPVWKHK